MGAGLNQTQTTGGHLVGEAAPLGGLPRGERFWDFQLTPRPAWASISTSVPVEQEEDTHTAELSSVERARS